MDPLILLPPEVILQILEHVPIADLAILTAISKPWHDFIDQTHAEVIYAAENKTWKPSGARDLSFLNKQTSFAKYYKDVPSWRELSKRQKLLARNWNAVQPSTKESVLQVCNDPVWRFQADFERRIILSTSQAGGLHVTDMDTGALLWSLPSTLQQSENAVRPYAHLEYDSGMAVFDREGDALEVWQTGLGGLERGQFRRIATLPHDCQTRGFQLSFNTLCVVSTQGQGFVYDMQERPPQLSRRLSIEHDAVGHLYQNVDVVMYCMGASGYHFYNKASGEFIGTLDPRHCSQGNRHHIKHPSRSSTASSATRHGSTARLYPPERPRNDRLMPIKLEAGPLPAPSDPNHIWFGDDEWGAGVLQDDLMVGFSRAGRVFVCCDWHRALQSRQALDAHSTIIECECDGTSFDLGGWLSVKDHRIMFEIQDRVYVVGLGDDNRVRDFGHSKRPSYSLFTNSAPQLTVPVSFMALFDDCIMTTFTTLGWRQQNQAARVDQDDGPIPRIFPTKAIRILSLAPDLEDRAGAVPLMEPASHEGDEEGRTQAALLQLVTMMGDDLDNEDDDLGVMDADFHGGE